MDGLILGMTGLVAHSPDCQVKRVYVEKRANEIVNRLNKTKVEKFPDLAQEKIQRDKIDRQASRHKELQQVTKKNKHLGT
jgi:hypothetical protein